MREGKAVRKSKKKPKRTSPSKPAKLRTRSGRSLAGARANKNLGAISLPKMTKQAQMIAMLRQEPGVSIAAIAAATGWQRHSVRGFFAAVVKKRFGFDLTSYKGDIGERLYRIDILSGGHRRKARDHDG